MEKIQSHNKNTLECNLKHISNNKIKSSLVVFFAVQYMDIPGNKN